MNFDALPVIAVAAVVVEVVRRMVDATGGARWLVWAALAVAIALGAWQHEAARAAVEVADLRRSDRQAALSSGLHTASVLALAAFACLGVAIGGVIAGRRRTT